MIRITAAEHAALTGPGRSALRSIDPKVAIVDWAPEPDDGTEPTHYISDDPRFDADTETLCVEAAKDWSVLDNAADRTGGRLDADKLRTRLRAQFDDKIQQARAERAVIADREPPERGVGRSR